MNKKAFSSEASLSSAVLVAFSRYRRWWLILTSVYIMMTLGCEAFLSVTGGVLFASSVWFFPAQTLETAVFRSLIASVLATILFFSPIAGGWLQMVLKAARGLSPEPSFGSVNHGIAMALIAPLSLLLYVSPLLLGLLIFLEAEWPEFLLRTFFLTGMPGPIVILAVSVSFAGYLSIDEGVDPIAGLRKSFNYTKGCLGQLVALALISYGLFAVSYFVMFYIVSSAATSMVKGFCLIICYIVYMVGTVMLWISHAWIYDRRRRQLEDQIFSEGISFAPRPMFPSHVTGEKMTTHEIDFYQMETMKKKIMSSMFGLQSDPIRIKHYIIIRVAGKGGMGVVYEAYDPHLERKVAIKMIHGVHDEETRARFQREAKAMALISHNNVVSVYDFGEIRGRLFIVMEFINGITLSEWLKASRRRTEATLSVFRGAGKGLAAIHDAGLVHRDFKPENVMVLKGGRAVVMDFGIARGVAESSGADKVIGTGAWGAVTQTGMTLGTPLYMAPEQWRGQPVSELADQFSFCTALWMALYGEHPFDSTSMDSLRDSVCSGEIRIVSSDGDMGAWVQRSLLRGLSLDPDARFDSMAKLLDAVGESPRVKAWRRARGLGLSLAVAAVLSLVGGFSVSKLSDLGFLSLRDTMGSASDSALAGISTDGLVLWLRANGGVNTGSAGVLRWADRSSMLNDASRSKVYDVGPQLAEVNGEPVIVFENGGQLELERTLELQDFTAIIVYRSPGGEDVQFLLTPKDYSGKGYTLGLHGGEHAFVTPFPDMSPWMTEIDSTSVLSLRVLVVQRRGNLWSVGDGFKSEELTISADLWEVGVIGEGGADGSFRFRGELAEVIIYDRTLSNMEKDLLCRYVSDSHGLYTTCDSFWL